MKVRAIQITEHGGPDVMHLADIEVGEPGPGQVRVRHHACGINYVDTYFRSGLYPAPLPLVPGTEAAGVVEAVGAGVTRLAVGDRVTYAAMGPGSYSEARVLDAGPVVRLPDSIDFERAAAMTLKGMTVQYLLKRTWPSLRTGDAILWHAAAGGVGLIACQWASALGYVVIATAGSAEKCKLALDHGAAHAIDYHREDVVARVKQLTGGRGVAVAFDAVGKDTFERSLDSTRALGLVAVFGNASGAVPPFDVLGLMRRGSLFVTRPTLGTHLAAGAAQEMADDLFAMVSAGKVRIDPPRTYPLADAARAHRELEAGKTTGAGILVV